MTQYVNNMAERPASMTLRVEKQRGENAGWLIEPQLLVYPKLRPKHKRHLIFVLDASISLAVEHRLEYLKLAVLDMLNKLSVQDKFSVIAFNQVASGLMESKTASASHVSQVRRQLSDLLADGEANFIAPFEYIKQQKLIEESDDTSIIFLTDGNNVNPCASTDLIRILTLQDVFPRIIPVGIAIEVNSRSYVFLSDLARLANHGATDAIFVQEVGEQACKAALQQAYDCMLEHSVAPVRIKISIEAKHEVNSTLSVYQRELSPLRFDGKTVHRYACYFPSFSRPTACHVEFSCNQVSLVATHHFSESDFGPAADMEPVSIPLWNVRSQDHRLSSWLKPITTLMTGAAFIAGGLTFLMLGLPSVSALVNMIINAVVAAVGLGLFARGVVLVGRKTFFLPSVLQPKLEQEAVEEEKKEMSVSSVRPSVRALQIHIPPAHTPSVQSVNTAARTPSMSLERAAVRASNMNLDGSVAARPSSLNPEGSAVARIPSMNPERTIAGRAPSMNPERTAAVHASHANSERVVATAARRPAIAGLFSSPPAPKHRRSQSSMPMPSAPSLPASRRGSMAPGAPSSIQLMPFHFHSLSNLYSQSPPPSYPGTRRPSITKPKV